MQNQRRGRQLGNVILESYSQMMKENRRTKNLVKTEKMYKMVEFNPKHKYIMEPQRQWTETESENPRVCYSFPLKHKIPLYSPSPFLIKITKLRLFLWAI